jgi:hypothetical protein
MFPNEGGQKHLVGDAKDQWGSKERNGCRAESERESCVKWDRQINEETSRGQNWIEGAVSPLKISSRTRLYGVT